MSGNLPAESEIELMICDDVRIELNQKLTLVGVYMSNNLNVADIGKNFSIPLTFLIIIKGGEGRFSMRASIKSPSGEKIAENSEEIEKIKNVTAVHLTKIINFPLPQAGIYNFDIYLDDKLFARPFTIRHDPSITKT